MERLRYTKTIIPTDTGNCVVKIAKGLPLDHPVVEGFKDAVHLLGDKMPDVVRLVIIKREQIVRSGNRLGVGFCDMKEDGERSDITLYAGSLTLWAGESWHAIAQAQETTLHEVGHAMHAFEIREGFCFGPQQATKEQIAEANKLKLIEAYHRRNPPKTWNEVLEERE